MVARVLALVVAVGMVAGALALRARLDERDGDEAAGDAPGQAPPASFRLTCSEELGAACERIRAADARVVVAVEAGADTAERLAALASGADPGLDAWLVAGPWPQIVAERRAAAARPAVVDAADAPVLARSPAVVVAWAERERALAASSCPLPSGWRCLGEAAGKDWSAVGGQAAWGTVKVGLPEPDGAGELAVLGGIAASYLGRSDFAVNDPDYADVLVPKLGDLARATAAQRDASLERVLAVGPAQASAVATLEAEARPLVAAAARGASAAVVVPQPEVTADVAVVPAAGAPGGAALADLVRAAAPEALAATGWRVAGQPGAPGVGPAEELGPNALPRAGLLDALRGTWEDAR